MGMDIIRSRVLQITFGQVDVEIEQEHSEVSGGMGTCLMLECLQLYTDMECNYVGYQSLGMKGTMKDDQ